MRLGILMADGCEEIEGLTVVDVLRRANIEIQMISIGNSLRVTGSHQITFETDFVFEEVDFSTLKGLILPGGIPGTPNLAAHEGVISLLHQFAEEKKLLAAICAAPSILGKEGLLVGKTATCHPGFESELMGAHFTNETVFKDGCFITSRGMGTAIDFALEIVAYFTNPETVETLKTSMVYSK